MLFERPDARDASGAGGYLSVKISDEDPALVATMQAPRAADVAKLLQYPSEQVTVSKVGERQVVTIAASDTARGEGLGLPDKVTNMRIFLSADKRAAVFVATNVLGDDDVADYIASIEG